MISHPLSRLEQSGATKSYQMGAPLAGSPISFPIRPDTMGLSSRPKGPGKSPGAYRPKTL